MLGSLQPIVLGDKVKQSTVFKLEIVNASNIINVQAVQHSL